MNLFDIASEIDDKAVGIERVLAVLSEAGDYFVLEDERKYLSYYADHISSLISVVAWLLRDMEKEMRQLANTMYKNQGVKN